MVASLLMLPPSVSLLLLVPARGFLGGRSGVISSLQDAAEVGFIFPPPPPSSETPPSLVLTQLKEALSIASTALSTGGEYFIILTPATPPPLPPLPPSPPPPSFLATTSSSVTLPEKEREEAKLPSLKDPTTAVELRLKSFLRPRLPLLRLPPPPLLPTPQLEGSEGT